MRILVSGASGLIGSHLVPALESNRHQVFRLVRRLAGSDREVLWEPSAPPKQLGGFDAVVHLAGETIMGRWTAKKKARILDSRRTGTRTLATALAAAVPRAKIFIVASAIGYYGPRGDDTLTEESPPGNDFLAQVACEWESACDPARGAGIRVVNLRLGMVLSGDGGALRQMLPPFRLGLGGRIGSGKQWVSWVAIDDVVAVVGSVLKNESLAGAINLTAPNPVTNAEFTRALGMALHRPTPFPLPPLIVRLAFGEMGKSLLLSGQRVLPRKLEASGYKFLHTEVGEALQSMLR